LRGCKSRKKTALLRFATVPYGLQFLAMLLTTFIFSFLMKKLGRHLVFQFGCVCLFLAGVLGYLALQQQQFYYYA
jgi:hypothetical protein